MEVIKTYIIPLGVSAAVRVLYKTKDERWFITNMRAMHGLQELTKKKATELLTEAGLVQDTFNQI